MIKASELISKNNPLTVASVNKFADSINVGDHISTVIRIRKWTSNSNFTYIEKNCSVEITGKYPYIVEFQYQRVMDDGELKTIVDTLSWNDFVLGYCRCAGIQNMEFSKIGQAA